MSLCRAVQKRAHYANNMAARQMRPTLAEAMPRRRASWDQADFMPDFNELRSSFTASLEAAVLCGNKALPWTTHMHRDQLKRTALHRPDAAHWGTKFCAGDQEADWHELKATLLQALCNMSFYCPG